MRVQMPDQRRILTNDDQCAVIEFLSCRSAYRPSPEQVKVIQTHGALVFLAGSDVYKIKRAVKYDYMDFSTLQRRRLACEREFEVNQPHAPQIYLGTIAITREETGKLAIGGSGIVVEWAVHMRRFPDDALLSNMMAKEELTPQLVKLLAIEVARYHQRGAVKRTKRAARSIAAIVDELEQGLSSGDGVLAEQLRKEFIAQARKALCSMQELLNQRGRDGYVRRLHGDLHSRNVVVIDGRPLLFDAIEFDEEIATIDTLYDLAFLLMDFDVAGHRKEANWLLGQYFFATGSLSDIDALAALPLFMGLRAGIRAMVEVQRAGLEQGHEARNDIAAADKYLRAAVSYFEQKHAHLIAVGGFSGTGKSTLAAGLAPTVGPAPGALHIRSDLERKALFGVGETTRLPPSSYTKQSSERVYRAVLSKAERALRAGHWVVVDAAFLRPQERKAIEAVARSSGACFTGLWLQAPESVLIERVLSRKDDASDATAEVVRKQLASDPGPIAWEIVDASGSKRDALGAAISRLACGPEQG